VGLFRIILCSGNKRINNSGTSKEKILGGDLEGINYRLGFYHNCFSLLNWESFFPDAELVELKKYGPAAQYRIRFPEAQNGCDLTVYIDSETFLPDRLVFYQSQPGAQRIQVVNRLRDYKEFDGILFPTRIIYDKVGWEVPPTHYLIQEITVNPPIDDALYESAEIDFGDVACEGNTITGEVRGKMTWSILTNVSEEDLKKIGVKEKDWLDAKVGDDTLEVKYLYNIQASAKEMKPGEVYLCHYFISQYPRLMLMAPGFDVNEKITCEDGEPLVLTRREKE
jgi:hypothetical protein